MPLTNTPRAATLTLITLPLTTFATLVPLLAQAAALFSHLANHATRYLASHTAATAGSTAPSHQKQLRDIQRHLAHLTYLQATHHRAAAATAQPAAPALTPANEPPPRPGTGSPIGAAHLATLARPPAHQHPTDPHPTT